MWCDSLTLHNTIFLARQRPRIYCEVTKFHIQRDAMEEDKASDSRAWPKSDAVLTNSVSFSNWMAYAWGALPSAIQIDFRACPTSWSVSTTEKRRQRRWLYFSFSDMHDQHWHVNYSHQNIEPWYRRVYNFDCRYWASWDFAPSTSSLRGKGRPSSIWVNICVVLKLVFRMSLISSCLQRRPSAVPVTYLGLLLQPVLQLVNPRNSPVRLTLSNSL